MGGAGAALAVAGDVHTRVESDEARCRSRPTIVVPPCFFDRPALLRCALLKPSWVLRSHDSCA